MLLTLYSIPPLRDTSIASFGVLGAMLCILITGFIANLVVGALFGKYDYEENVINEDPIFSSFERE